MLIIIALARFPKDSIYQAIYSYTVHTQTHSLSHLFSSSLREREKAYREREIKEMQTLNDDQLFDVIIIGAGIMGSATAYHAAKRGLNTLLLEQFDFLHHRGSSHGESRTIRVTYPQPHYYPLVMESYSLWEQAQDQIGYRVYFPADHLDMGPSDDPIIIALIDNCQKHNIPHEVLRRPELIQKFSGRIDIPDDWIALFNHHGGVIKPTKAVAMFLTLAHKNGAVLRDNSEVVDIKREKDQTGITVSTAGGKFYRGKKCIVTVGAWVNKVLKKVNGIELPIQPMETHVFYWRVKEGHEEKFASGGDFPTFASSGEIYVYGTPSLEYAGLIKVAVHDGKQCDPDKRPWGSGVKVEELKEWVEKRFNGLVDSSEPVVKQACMYSMTPEEDFVIDFLGGEFGKDVVVGGGFSGHGFKMGPVIGRILCELAVDGEASGVDMEPFRIGRF